MIVPLRIKVVLKLWWRLGYFARFDSIDNPLQGQLVFSKLNVAACRGRNLGVEGNLVR